MQPIAMTGGELVRRWVAYAFGVGSTALVLSPLATRAPDSFPISTYPMFARSPGQPTLYAVVRIDRDGRERRLPAELVGSTEVLQAKVMIQRSVELGPRGMAELCRATASRVVASDGGDALRFVDIVRRRYDPIAYFVIAPTPLEQERIYRCRAPKSGAQRARSAPELEQ